ncbi:RNA-directed DNA polymerase, eukaryota, reverse transcriptase zinc-binding domain protein [Tanacetum coccineum]
MNGYEDPTYIETKSVNHKSDMYSFGIVMFELLCGRKAVIDDDQDNNKYLASVAVARYREKKLDEIIDWDLWNQMDSQSFNIFAEIAYDCLHEEPLERPNIGEIVMRLKKALEFQQEHHNASACHGRNIRLCFAEVLALVERFCVAVIGVLRRLSRFFLYLEVVVFSWFSSSSWLVKALVGEGCSGGNGKGLTKKYFIDHLGIRHFKTNDLKVSYKVRVTSDFSLFSALDSALHQAGIWLCGSCDSGIPVLLRPDLSVVDSTSAGILPTDSEAFVDEAIFQVHSLGVESICFDINLLSRVFSKKLRTVKCIPPRLRLGFAKLFCGALDNVLVNPGDLSVWVQLLILPCCVLSTFVPTNRAQRRSGEREQCHGVKKSNKHDEANVVQCKRKPGDGHFTAAIKVLTSSGVAPSTPATLHELEAKHPYAPPLSFSSSSLGVDALFVHKDLVLNRIRSFLKGTLCGRDGLRAQHLMDILGGAAFAVADDLLGSITGVVNLFLSGIHPIVVGTVWRRLVSKVAYSAIGNSMNTYLHDFQFGVGIPGGCEGVLHYGNRLIESKGNDVGLSMLLVDFKNAFNLVDKGVLLEETRVQCLSISPWVEFCYARPAGLCYDESVLVSCQGAWYLDDGTIVGDTLMVAKAIDIIKTDGPTRGMFLNVDKPELFWHVDDPRSKAEGVFPINISRSLNSVKLLGGSVSLDEGFCRDLALKRVSKTISLVEAIHKLYDPQCDLLFLCNCVGVAKLSYALRTWFGDWQWRLATLPIKLGGLGILSAGDISKYAFLASRLQTSALQAKILMKSGIDSEGSSFKHAFDAFNTTCNVDVSILSCIRASHAHDFLFTIPIDGLGHRMKHHQFCSVLCYRLSVPMFFEGSLCPSCNAHQMDQWEDHAVHCSSEVGIMLIGWDLVDLRPANLLLFNWLQALHNVVEKKKMKYASICEENGYKFIPFAFSTFVEFETEALDTLSRIKSISIIHLNNAKSEAFIFHRDLLQDEMHKISTSIFVTNFPDQFCAKDLWKVCNQYGNVVDAFIPYRRSKSGKRFGFVRFIKVIDVDRLVNNLCTIWVDRFKLHANISRFQRSPLNNSTAPNTNKGGKMHVPNDFNKDSRLPGYPDSYIHTVKRGTQSHNVVEENKPAIVLDETCLNQESFSTSLMGEVKDFSSLTNLKVVLDNEGFDNIKLKYMGGYWVMIDFQTEDSKEKFKANMVIGSWFSHLQQAATSFHIDERVTWVDIEGIPLKVRAKEVSGWIPDFMDDEKENNDSDGEIREDGLHDENAEKKEYENLEGESDVEEVSETIFEKDLSQGQKKDDSNVRQNDSRSEDPLKIYDLLNKKKDNKNRGSYPNDTMKYPSGFTPMATDDVHSNDFKEMEKEVDERLQNIQVYNVNSEVGKTCHISISKEDKEESICSGHFKKVELPRTGGSMLQLMQDLVKVGQTMGYNMEGCSKSITEIIETKMETIEMLNIKACWGNFTFQHVYSPFVGYSGGILCVWDSRMFYKFNSTVSDYFVIIRGKWIPNGKTLLIISIYAPQDLSEKKMLWDYLIVVIANWNGDVVIMGDFNEVRTQAERCGFIFNVQGANAFNSFILAAGLEKVPLASTLDRYLSDHRPILMREAHFDYGPIPFHFYHYWFKIEGFDTFVERTWNEANMYDSNAISKFMKKMKYIKNHIRVWIKDKKEYAYKQKMTLKEELADIDFLLDKGEGNSDILNKRDVISKSLQDIEKLASMEKDVVEAVSYFFQYGMFPKGGSLYKIITKILSNRLVVVLGDIVNEVQLAFVANRQILDDDVVFMSQWNSLNIDVIIQVLECFYRTSGIRINMNKRKLMGISVPNGIVDHAANKIGCKMLKAPLSNLGSKVGDLMSRTESWNDIINNLTARLSKWKMKTLSIGGRLTLLKSVLGSMPIYHLSLFKAPMKVLQKMESIRCRFFNGVDHNGKKPIWVKWSKVLASKEKGGLGVSSLYALNRALLFKWVWRFYTQRFLLWAKVIRGIHGEDGNMCKNGKQSHTSIWLDIVRETALLKSQGSDLSEKMSHANLVFSLRRHPRGGIEQEQFTKLLASVERITLANMRDRWVWSKEGSGKFAMAFVRRMIDTRWLPNVSAKTRWTNVVPIKINVHAWKVRLDCLPTRLNISRRGMDIDSILCPSCGMAVESASHAFFTCHVAKDVFHKIYNWWDVNYMDLSSYKEWLEWLLNLRLHSKQKRRLKEFAILCDGLFGIFVTRVFLDRILLPMRLFLRILGLALFIGVDIEVRLPLVG